MSERLDAFPARAEGLPAHDAPLAGSGGCGKSSLVKALLPRHARQGLRR